MQALVNWDRDHPILRWVELSDLWIQEPGSLSLPESATIMAVGQAGPVMAELDHEGVRHMVVSFPLNNSNWPLMTSFVPFMFNAIQTLALGSAGTGMSYRSGEVAVVPAESGAKELIYSGPVPLRGTVEKGRATLAMFDRVGVYRAAGGTGAVAPWDRLAVNLNDGVESDLHVPETLMVSATSQQVLNQTSAIRQEKWRWFIWAALGMLLVEWVVYTRRMHL